MISAHCKLQAQTILPLQPPKRDFAILPRLVSSSRPSAGLKLLASSDPWWDFAILPRLVSSSQPPVILLPWLPKVLGLQSLTLLPRLECSGETVAHGSLHLLGSSNPPTSAS
ncbi:hypothetical protein AAY473_018667 [Plecturocebus cupreus]